MVHNGIEYGDMQLIAEAYDILKRGLELPEKEIADIFAHVCRSFGMSITAYNLVVARRRAQLFPYRDHP